MKRFWVKKAFGFLLIAPIIFALVTLIVMGLWNSVLVAVLHVGAVTFWQAAGILLLSKILFGFGGRHWKGRDHKDFVWRKQMMEKWSAMTPEERVKFKQEFRNRCAGKWREEGPYQRPGAEENIKVD